MPPTAIRVFRTRLGPVPLLDWLVKLQRLEARAYRKSLQRILLLASLGNELRRPLADLLQDGIYELRIKVGRVNYRILYFFCGPNIACLSHGLAKEGAVPASEIETAIQRKRFVLSNLDRYTAEWEM